MKDNKSRGFGDWRFALSPKPDLKEIEEAVRRFWQECRISEKIAEARASASVLGFVEGPPTLNGEPHIGHVRGRIFKDLWYRHETMAGNYVLFRSGWDTQGLPVELQAEKELGLKGNKTENLRAVGEEKLVEACKQIVRKYGAKWMEADRYLGLLLDYNGYWTYDDRYIEREWKVLEAAYRTGLLGEGHRVVAYCPSCQTSLSNREVALGYEVVKDPSLYYKVRLRDEDAFLLVWTTMPFTVVTDELVAVNPEADYSYVRVGEEVWVVGEARLKEVARELKIERYDRIRTVKGSQLDGMRYLPPLAEFVPGQRDLAKGGKVHIVVAESFVDPTTGSGIVHLSPANGEEDFEVASKRGLPIFNPIDDEARFTGEAGDFQGVFVRDADAQVVKALASKGLVALCSEVEHEYPTCWRSGHKLVYLLRREYFYWVDRILDRTVAAAEGVEYYYESPKNRFLEIIKEARPWNISRERVWGAPLPIWVCTGCGEKVPLFSRKAIVESALRLPDGPNFELHRPWIDRVVVRCPKCGGESYREPFVLDTWHNSGAAPYAGSTDEEYRRLVPVPFLTEGIDQTRGWAYTLLVENVILSGRPQAPYRAFLFQGHVLDEKGEKMSKSKGNTVEALPLFKEWSVDLTRFYLLWKAAPVDALSFDFKEMAGRPYQVLNTLYHLHLYYQANAGYDGFVWDEGHFEALVKGGSLLPQDRWLLSVLQGLVRVAEEAYEKRRFNDAARAFDSFIVEQLSQRYVPMTREELWEDLPETKPRREAIYAVLGFALRTIDVLMHPYTPFLTDYLFNSVFASKPQSLVLGPLPQRRDDLVDASLEREFERLWGLLSLANSARTKARLKRRWPLRRAYYYAKGGLSPHVEGLLAQMANAHEVQFRELKDLPVKLVVRVDPAKVGGRLKRYFGLALKEIERRDPWELKKEAEGKGHVTIVLDGREHKILREELSFEVVPLDGYSSAEDEGGCVVLDVVRDEELVSEGLVRDLARRLQALRKEKGYVPTDLLPKASIRGLDEEAARMVRQKEEKLLFLVRVKELEVSTEPAQGEGWKESEIDGRKVQLYI